VQGGADWQGSQQLGVIAGAHGFGVGHVLGGLTGLNDGTVTVAETYLPGAHDSLQLKTSHTGLIVSRKVAQAVCCFLHSGHFASG